MTGWLAVFAAGLFEIAWAFGLKYSDGLTRFWPTLATALAILASFALMAFALRSLPFGTAYAIWTGIGAAGSIVLGMVIFSEPTDPVRIICLTLIVAGMVGLKLNSPVCNSRGSGRRPLRAKAAPRFDAAEQDQRDRERHEMIEKTEHQ